MWFDENTANAICSACFHPSSRFALLFWCFLYHFNLGFQVSNFLFTCVRIMIACLSFLLDYEKIEEEDDSDASSSDEDTPHKAHVAINREDIYKVSFTLS